MAVAITSTDSGGQYPLGGGTTVTFAGVSIGAAAASRLVFVCVAWLNAATEVNLLGVTVGGAAAAMASSVVLPFAVNSTYSTWYLLVPTGTTADVVLSLSGDDTGNAALISVYAVTGADVSSPVSSTGSGTSAGSNDVSATIAVPVDGGMIANAGGFSAFNAPTTWAWTNATKDTDVQLVPVVNQYFLESAAHSLTSGAYTVNANYVGVFQAKCMTVVAIAPVPVPPPPSRPDTIIMDTVRVKIDDKPRPVGQQTKPTGT